MLAIKDILALQIDQITIQEALALLILQEVETTVDLQIHLALEVIPQVEVVRPIEHTLQAPILVEVLEATLLLDQVHQEAVVLQVVEVAAEEAEDKNT